MVIHFIWFGFVVNGSSLVVMDLVWLQVGDGVLVVFLVIVVEHLVSFVLSSLKGLCWSIF